MATLRRLLSREEIQERIRSLAKEISQKYRETNPLLLGVMKGSLHFLSDLSRALEFPHGIDFLRVNSYKKGTLGTPGSRVEHFSCLEVKGRDVILVDEILDRGHTVGAIEPFIRSLSPRSHTWAFLLVKQGARERAGLDPAYVGFEIGEDWVVGYGMDLDEAYRGFPEIFRLESPQTGG